MLFALTATAQAAWVLQADTTRSLNRAMRLVDRHTEEVPQFIDVFTVCIPMEAPSERVERRVTRTLQRPPEERLDCDVAWFRLGRGWIAVLIEQPAEGLDDLLADAALPYLDVRVPSTGEPIRLCVARAALVEPMALARRLTDGGLQVRSVYEIGACSR